MYKKTHFINKWFLGTENVNFAFIVIKSNKTCYKFVKITNFSKTLILNV